MTVLVLGISGESRLVENMATSRHIAFNVLKADTSFKAGMKRKQKRASRNNAYLSQVLAGLGGS